MKKKFKMNSMGLWRQLLEFSEILDLVVLNKIFFSFSLIHIFIVYEIITERNCFYCLLIY